MLFAILVLGVISNQPGNNQTMLNQQQKSPIIAQAANQPHVLGSPPGSQLRFPNQASFNQMLPPVMSMNQFQVRVVIFSS